MPTIKPLDESKRTASEAFKPVAEAATKEAGQRGKEGGRGKKKTPGKSLPKGKRDETKRTASVAATPRFRF